MRNKQTKTTKAPAGVRRPTKPVPMKAKFQRSIPRGLVWAAWSGGNMEFEGFVVTDRRDPNKIICVLPEGWKYDNKREERKDRKTMLRAARRIAANPDLAGSNQWAVDYRDMQNLQSSPTRIIPAEIYGWRLSEVVGDEPPDRFRGGRQFSPLPFCRFRFALMLEQFCAQRFPSDRLLHPINGVMVSGPDGTVVPANVTTPPQIFQMRQREEI